MDELMKAEQRVRIISFASTVAKFRRGVMEAVEASNEARKLREKQQQWEGKTASSAAAAAAASSDAVAASGKSKAKRSKS